MADQKQPSGSQPSTLAGTIEKKQGVKRPLEYDNEGRPRFHGCSKHSEYEVVSKLGEGTFGYGSAPDYNIGRLIDGFV